MERRTLYDRCGRPAFYDRLKEPIKFFEGLEDVKMPKIMLSYLDDKMESELTDDLD